MSGPEHDSDTRATSHARGTAVAKGRFLEAVARTGNISQAAREVPIHRATHHKWMAEPKYAADFRDALEMFKDSLRAEITRRGRDGWDETVAGNLVRKFSDRMLELQAKALMPEYRDGLRPSDDVGGVAEVGETWEEMREARKALDRAKAGQELPVDA